jgi:hypothetical protein
MRRVQRKDFRKPAEFQYATAKQDLQVKDLRRYGISGVLVDDYSEYTEVLKRISDRFKRGSVFISGSAATYDPFTESVAQQLLHETARRLIREGFTVVSGFGLGVGSYVLNGVLDELQREATQALDDRLILRPFPFNIADATERQRVWKKYREDMMSHAGIAVFMFGNKQDATGNTIYSDGVEAEFNIAVEKGLVVVPVGCTGSVSEKLHRKVMDSFPDYYPQRGYKAKVNLLGKRGTPIQVATRIVDLLKALRDGD